MTLLSTIKRHVRSPKLLLMLGSGMIAAAAFATASSEHMADAASPQGGVRRLTEAQYRATIADIFGPDIKVVGRFEPDLRVDGLIAVGTSAVSVTPGGLDQYEELARGIAGQVTDDAHRAKLVGCAPGAGDADGAQCLEGFFSRVGLKLYRRPLTPAETQLATATALESAKTLGSFPAGLAAALTGLLTSPDFLFRIDTPSTTGRSVNGYSKAVKLSFLLWNSAPDAQLLAAAGRGELDTPAGLSRQVDRLIGSPRFTDGIRAFFSDFLLLDDMDSLSKDLLLYPSFTTSVSAALREQTLRTITDLLVTHKGDYRDLFTTRRLAMTRELGPIYTVPVAAEGWSFHEFPQGDPRTGLLTQAGLLALHSHPGRTSPTLRGKAIRETLLCEKIPSPPANVNFAVVQDTNNPTLKTTRARLQAHLDDEECASCHKLTDPIGLGLEAFDGAGQFRVTEHDEVIDTSGTFDKVDFKDAVSLGQLFHDSSAVASCLVSSTWRYATGRSIGAIDQPVVAKLDNGFRAGGYKMVDLMRAIALEPAFYATPAVTRARLRVAASPSSGKPS